MEASRRRPFGTTLRRFREAAALSQEDLAERAGLSLRGISDLERGVRTTPRLETVRMLADGLGLDHAQRSALLAARNYTDHPPRSRPGQSLPIPPTSFIGRQEEIAEVVGMLKEDATRLITLTGPGGVGKTRIALEIARHMADSFAGEVVFVELSAVRIPELVIPTIADSLGVAAQVDREIKDVLVVALLNRPMFLVLDNLEQVIAAAMDIAWLLTSCPALKMIVTSRIILRISAEHVVPVEPLPLPTYHDVYALQQLDAVMLFAARAHAIDHAFSLNQDTAPTVAAVIGRLQGMPLAIELAAARLRTLSLPDLVRRLDTQLAVLVGGARDLPDRHRTMRSTIAWSYDLLSPIDQKVLRFLAIFPDGCLLEALLAILEVGYHLDEVEAFEAIEALVNSSMVQRQYAADGQVRYRMLQPIREFGLHQLSLTDEEPAARRAAHSAWFVPLAHKIEYAMDLPDAVYHLNRTEAEHQNLREHLAWLVAQGYAEDALDISAALAFFRAIRSYFAESRQELEALLNHPQNQIPDIIRMRGLIGLGVVLNQQSSGGVALPFLEEAVQLARDLNEPWYLSLALLSLGLSHHLQRDLDTAEQQFREGQAVATAIGATFLTVANMHIVGVVAGMRGDLPLMKKLLHEGLSICESAGLVWGIAVSKINLALVYIEENDLDRAETLAREAQALFFDIENRRDGTGVYLTLADIALRRGDLPAAELLLRPALENALDTGDMVEVATSCKGLSTIARLSGDIRSAQEHIRNAIHWYERGNLPVDAICCLEDVAEIAIATSDAVRASWCAGAVDSVLARHGIARTDKEAEEYQARASAGKSQLGEELWRHAYERGAALSEMEILDEYHSWHF